ncbi:unnamed protein product [Lampetra planeri]
MTIELAPLRSERGFEARPRVVVAVVAVVRKNVERSDPRGNWSGELSAKPGLLSRRREGSERRSSCGGPGGGEDVET